MTVTVCVGSSCHLKGSKAVVEELERLAAKRGVELDLRGAFCMGKCTGGVCVKIDETVFSLRPEDTEAFFENEIMTRL